MTIPPTASWTIQRMSASQWRWWQVRELVLVILDSILIVASSAIFLGLGAIIVTNRTPLAPIEFFLSDDPLATVFWIGIALLCFLVYRFSVYWIHDPLWPPKGSRIQLSRHCSRALMGLLHSIPAPITLTSLWAYLLKSPPGMFAAIRSELPVRELTESFGGDALVDTASSQAWASDAVEQIVIQSSIRASETHKGKIAIGDILWAAAGDDGSERLFKKFPGALSAMKVSIDRTGLLDQLHRRAQYFGQMARFHPRGPMNIAMTATATPMLDAVSIDLTARAAGGGFQPLAGRTKELIELFSQLEGQERRIVVVGWSGVGKSAFIQEVAQQMVEGTVPPILYDRRLLSIEPSRLIAGATHSGEVEYRLGRLVSEISRSQNIALVLEQIEQFIGLGTSGEQLDVLDQLLRIVERSGLVVIATTTPDQFQKHLEAKTNFTTIFHTFELAEMSAEGTMEALVVHAAMLERRDRLIITTPALQEIIEGAARAIHDQFFPSKAILALDHAVSTIKRRSKGIAICTKVLVDAALGEMTHVPIGSATGAERDLLLHFESIVRRSVVGQAHAIDRIANALRRARTRLDRRNRPIGNFLFVGPTGVGKTHLAKTVAATLFGESMHLVRLDMSEFQGSNSVERFLGTPGSGRGGVVTEQLRQNPYCLLLLDELEKASPKILTLLLQLMDEGRVTDVTGRTIDATNMLVIATSNIATPFITQAFAAGRSVEQVHHELVERELPELLPLELLNRFDDIIVFEPLNREDIESIAMLELGYLRDLLQQKGIEVEFAPATITWIAQLGFDPQYGARPLKRAIADNLEDPLSQAILKGQIAAGSHIRMEPGGQWSALP